MAGDDVLGAAAEVERGVVVEADQAFALRTGVDDAITGAEVDASMLSEVHVGM